MTKKAIKYYVVLNGRTPGIYKTWNDCLKQVDKYPKAIYKSFEDPELAMKYFVGKELEPLKDEEKKSENVYYAYPAGHLEDNICTWGLVISLNSEILYEFKGEYKYEYEENAPIFSHYGELQATIEAAKWAHENGIDIVICYRYDGVERWATGKWKTKKSRVKAYIEEVNKYTDCITFKCVSAMKFLKGVKASKELARTAQKPY